MNQYPNIRAHTICPRCLFYKDKGLVLCWPCHHELKEKYDGTYGPFEKSLVGTEKVVEARMATVRKMVAATVNVPGASS